MESSLSNSFQAKWQYSKHKIKQAMACRIIHNREVVRLYQTMHKIVQNSCKKQGSLYNPDQKHDTHVTKSSIILTSLSNILLRVSYIQTLNTYCILNRFFKQRGLDIDFLSISDRLSMDWFWSEWFWFPRNRPWGWKDLDNKPDSSEYRPQLNDLHWAIPLGLGLILVRYLLDK